MNSTQLNSTQLNGYNYILRNSYSKKILITLLSLTLLFSISCSNEGTTGGGNPVNVANAEFSGTLNSISLVGDGWTQEQVDGMVNPNPFILVIEDNKVGCSYIMQKQLRYTDSSNPNVVEANSEEVIEEEDGSGKTTFTAYIKITLDDANNPTTATVEYSFKLYSAIYSGSGMSDTVEAKYGGTLDKVVSSGS